MSALDAEPPLGEPPSAADVPDAPPAADRPGMRLPRTTYLWLFFLFLSYVLPPTLEHVVPGIQGTARSLSSKGSGAAALAPQDFETFADAEVKTRMAFASASFSGRKSSALAARRATLRAALRSYREVAITSPSPALTRRILILTHAAGLPISDALLLPASPAIDRVPHPLKAAEPPMPPSSLPPEEAKMWLAIYVAGHVDPQDAASDERRILAMHLGFLSDRALADLYRAAGSEGAADSYEHSLTEHADGYTLKLGGIAAFIVVAGIAGAVLLARFLGAARRGDWQRVGRVPTAPLRLGWGDLLDGFVFYLATFKFVGLVVGTALTQTGDRFTTEGRLLVVVALEVGVGIGALAYVAAAARRRGATLADLGLTPRGALGANVRYGVLAYLATLPAVYAFGYLSQIVFRHASNLAPNPVIPLLANERDTAGRILLFFLASVCAPFFEEFFFRGVLFSGLRTRLPWTTAAALSAVCFAAVHPMHDWLPVFALGFSLATVREMRQSLVPGIVIHFLQNTLTFFYMSILFSR